MQKYLILALFVLSLCPYDISVGVWAFVIGLSQISSLFSCIPSMALGMTSAQDYMSGYHGTPLILLHVGY